MQPDVTIILPTFNRVAFLPQAFASITAQTFTNWSLVIVDDGSTDGTKELVREFAENCDRPVKYLYQENRGAYSARNRGVEHARSKYLAFFDSDDLWMPGYLEKCVSALESVEEVDWVYAPCRMIEMATRKLIQPNTFFMDGRPQAFLNLRTHSINGVNVIVDPAVMECHLLNGLGSGLQNSIMRRSIVGDCPFDEGSRVMDDRHFVARVLAAGGRFGYLSEPQVIYHVHEDNSSAAATKVSAQKLLEISRESVHGLEQLQALPTLTRRERRALKQRLSIEYFWQLGYNSLWESGQRREALAAYRRSLLLWPWSLSRWKTYVLAAARVRIQRSAL